MAFPFTHLCVGYELLRANTMSEEDGALFLLGNIAPDAIHFREPFIGSDMKHIGPAKKVTHLCPVNNEVWGSVTDNEGWIQQVRSFLDECPIDPLRLGYASHVLTDILNNMTLWNSFRTKFPEEAAKGYTSDYYTDMGEIHIRLYSKMPYTEDIMGLLKKSNVTSDIYRKGELLVSVSEMERIKHNLAYENFKNAEKDITPNYNYSFVTFDDMLEYIEDTVKFIKSFIISYPMGTTSASPLKQ